MRAWLPAQCACAVLGGVPRIDIADDVEAVPHVNAVPSHAMERHMPHGKLCVTLCSLTTWTSRCMLPYTLDI